MDRFVGKFLYGTPPFSQYEIQKFLPKINSLIRKVKCFGTFNRSVIEYCNHGSFYYLLNKVVG